MKRTIIISTAAILLSFLLSLSTSFASEGRKKQNRPAPRGQWTEQQAWDWEKKIGEIRGFNQPESAYPGQTRREILAKAAEYGLNSVRFWIKGNNADEQIAYIREFADEADDFGISLSPVISLQSRYYSQEDEKTALAECEKEVRKLVAAFATDERIIFWDIWNEPRFRESEVDTFRNMDWIEKMVLWCREEGIIQPITSSIIWDTGFDADTETSAWKRRAEVESMMDIHNFHDYQAAENMGKDLAVTLRKIREISNRPMVCTECMTRVYGSGVQRTLAAFAREHIHFYLWGMFNNDANWSVKWSRSTYDPFEPMFHDLLWADGDMYDPREYEIIKQFHFLSPDEKDPDPGIPVTERWHQERAWKWMAGGPVTGTAIEKAKPSNTPEKYNSVRITINYNHWKYDNDAFFKDFDEFINWAEIKGMTIFPVLVIDDMLGVPEDELVEYVRSVIAKYYDCPTVKGWDLYFHPGEKVSNKGTVEKLVERLFTIARNQYPNQPVFMTPVVSVTPFAKDYDYRKDLVHGRIHGWEKLVYSGISDSDLVYRIWSLSDVISFSTDQPSAEAGWLLSICYRFGRPIICSSFKAEDPEQRRILLDQFSRSHVYWYSATDVPEEEINSFRFIPISTGH